MIKASCFFELATYLWYFCEEKIPLIIEVYVREEPVLVILIAWKLILHLSKIILSAVGLHLLFLPL